MTATAVAAVTAAMMAPSVTTTTTATCWSHARDAPRSADHVPLAHPPTRADRGALTPPHVSFQPMPLRHPLHEPPLRTIYPRHAPNTRRSDVFLIIKLSACLPYRPIGSYIIYLTASLVYLYLFIYLLYYFLFIWRRTPFWGRRIDACDGDDDERLRRVIGWMWVERAEH